MSKKRISQWEVNKGIAGAMLKDRTQRRRAMSSFAFVLLGVFAAGLWGIDGWLQENVWRFLFYWGGCALLALFLMVFALFDVLAVIREEREK